MKRAIFTALMFPTFFASIILIAEHFVEVDSIWFLAFAATLAFFLTLYIAESV